jgi:hypothetical protein
MKTFREYCMARANEAQMTQPNGSTVAFSPADMDLFNRAKMNIAQNAKLDMSKPIQPQMQNKAVADNVLKAAQMDPNFKKIKNPALNSIEGLQQAFSNNPNQNQGQAA